ncbi:MAG: CapA family protein, partial [Bacteroidetes bacterium]
MKKIYLPLGLLLFVALTGSSMYAYFSENSRQAAAALPRPEPAPVPATVDTLVPPALKDTLSFIGVGDIMDGTNYPSAAYLPADNGRGLWKPVNALLQDADITFGNLEGSVLTSGGSPKSCSDPSRCYVFRMPDSHVQNFVTAGFDVMSVANNHSGDMGASGRANTLKVLRENGIETGGLLTKPTAIFEKDGITYGFIAFAPNSGCLNLRDVPTAKRLIAALDSACDILIVSFHGGAEGSEYQHVPRKSETFFGENRGDVYAFAHAAIDAGADMVWGHGPHVVRAAELYKDRFIAYSMGNFNTYSRFSLDGIKGLAPIVKIYTNREGKFLHGKIISCRQPGEGGPEPDAQH